MSIKDHLGNIIELKNYPQRIISLVPSQTELLFHLGLDEQVAGLTKFCIHPANEVKAKTNVGGTKNFNIEKIKSIQPDLIIANKEENEVLGIKLLMEEFPVYVSDIKNLEDAFKMIADIGSITGKVIEAKKLIEEIKSEFKELQISEHRKISVAYLIWNDPYITVGVDTFINELLSVAGFENVFGFTTRYASTNLDEIISLQPEYIFLSSEPFPFKEKHIAVIQSEFPNQKIKIVDGEMFSWYGSRLLKSASYFKELREKL